jgi:hypothetical protein
MPLLSLFGDEPQGVFEVKGDNFWQSHVFVSLF